jgi:transcriptional regulator of arginine metabolism
MSKASRHRTILTLLGQRPAAPQCELQHALSKRGIQVGQATLSRDVHALGLVKGSRGYQPPGELGVPRIIAHRVISESVVGVRSVHNLLVLKTFDGDARPVAATLEEENWPEAIGTLAGQDTILIVCSDNRGARKLAARIRAQCRHPKARGRLGWWGHAVESLPSQLSSFYCAATPLPPNNPLQRVRQPSTR